MEGKRSRNSKREEEVSTAKSDGDPKDWNTIPPELLEMILALLHSPSEPAEMAKLRKVSKLWRDVIDEHFKFEVILDDGEMDVTQLSHLRVTPTVVVSSLQRQQLDPNSSVLQNPSEISELKITGGITPSNFQHLLKEAVNLKQLSLDLLDYEYQATNLFERTPGMSATFLERLRNLSMLVIAIKSVESLPSLVSKEIPNLTTFKLYMYPVNSVSLCTLVIITKSLFSFLDRSPSLKTLHLYALLRFPWIEHNSNTQLPVYNGDKQLDSLKVSTYASLLSWWLPLVKVQRSLKELDIRIPTAWCSSENYPMRGPENVCLCTALETTFRLNEATLVSICLEALCLSTNLNVALFENMSNLKRLELHRSIHYAREGEFSFVFNLGMLPNSIEILSLEGFTYEAADLRRTADRLVNAKRLTFLNKNNREEGIRGVWESFARKKISSMKIRPLQRILDENPHEVRDGKYFLLLNGTRVECQDYGIDWGGDYFFEFNFQN